MFIAETATQEQKEYRWKNTVKAVVATRQMLKRSLLGTGGLKVTCKDCIHYEACHDMYYEEHATRHFDPEKHNAEKECGYFKDRSRFVELPADDENC